MPKAEHTSDSPLQELEEQEIDLIDMPGWVFGGVTAYFDDTTATPNGEALGDKILDVTLAKYTLRCAGGQVSNDISDSSVTHIIMGLDLSHLPEIRQTLSKRRKLPRIVTLKWLQESWKERTRLDEERFAPS
jgi:DNA ligase 4